MKKIVKINRMINVCNNLQKTFIFCLVPTAFYKLILCLFLTFKHRMWLILFVKNVNSNTYKDVQRDQVQLIPLTITIKYAVQCSVQLSYFILIFIILNILYYGNYQLLCMYYGYDESVRFSETQYPVQETLG